MGDAVRMGNLTNLTAGSFVVLVTYAGGQIRITAAGTKLTDLLGGPIDRHWAKSLVASPHGSLLFVSVGSNSNITENGIEAEMDSAAIWGPTEPRMAPSS
jgi:glucose/arabinose dehydrogenase